MRAVYFDNMIVIIGKPAIWKSIWKENRRGKG